jgi:bla regulator protein blaR1
MLRILTAAGPMLVACHAFAQSGNPRPSFEVASIKRDKSGGRTRINPGPGGRFTARNAPLQMLITTAYSLRDFQLTQAPGWLMSERYDVEAKMQGDPSFAAMRLMLQTLFEDRLRLKLHRETKELPVYALVVGKPGKLHESEGACSQVPGAAAPPGKQPLPLCDILARPGRMDATRASMGGPLGLAEVLSHLTDRLVVDKTGLTGKYDFKLEWAPQPDEFPPPPGDAPPGVLSPSPADPNGPSLFTALQEQLGLKLESQKGPVEIMVIDHVERPSEN